jgi:membrane-associated phospholipid phosphatase
MIKNANLIFIGMILIPLSVFSMIFWDQPLALFLDFVFSDSLDKIANKITWLGMADVYFWIAAFGFLAAVVAQKRFHHKISPAVSKKYRERFRLMFNSFLISGLFAVVLKFIIGRCRPYHSPVFDPTYFKPFSFNWDFQSYPSGHTQVSFTLASFLSYLNPKLSGVFFSLATVIALTRVVLDYHFLGDIFLGAYIGILGFQVTLRTLKWAHKSE